MPITKAQIEKAYGSSFVEGNTIEIFPSGHEGFKEILHGIQGAQEVVGVNFYILLNDTTGTALADALIEKARKGVRVYVLYDNWASWRTPGRFWRKLRAAGIVALSSHPFNWRDPLSYMRRDHRKFVVVDGKVVFLGSLNMSDRALTFRETVIRIEGPVAANMYDIFNATWLTWGGASLPRMAKALSRKGESPIMPVFSYSEHAHKQIIHLLYWLIEHAEKSIDLTTPFFIPTPRMAALLVDAVHRGVRVRLLLPLHNKVRAVGYASMASFIPLEELGVEVYLYRTRMLHAKTYAFDGVCTFVGSANLDYQSLTENDESNACIFDAKVARNFSEIFETDMHHAEVVRLHEWLVLPWRKRILEIFFSLFRKHL